MSHLTRRSQNHGTPPASLCPARAHQRGRETERPKERERNRKERVREREREKEATFGEVCADVH